MCSFVENAKGGCLFVTWKLKCIYGNHKEAKRVERGVTDSRDVIYSFTSFFCSIFRESGMKVDCLSCILRGLR